MSRQDRAERRAKARSRDALARLGDRPLPALPLVGPAGRPTIADQEVLNARRVVKVKCRPCGAGMKGVRVMDGTRLVFGLPWIEITRCGNAVFTVACNTCGTVSTIRETDLVRAAWDGWTSGQEVPIPVG